MKEQSHKSEMRAAVRGDFERLHARRRETIEPSGPTPTSAAEQDEHPTAAGAGEMKPPRSSWLDRLRDRR